jgi:2-methylcitrate dehydratase
MPVLVKKFETSVAAHFGAKQTEAIKRMFVDRAALAALSVSDFMAQMVSAV